MQNHIDDYAVGFSAPLEFKFAAEAEASGTFEGYGATFDVKDLQGDIIVAGAFKSNIASGQPPAFLWHHNQSRPIGVLTSMKEDRTGLLVHGKFSLSTTEGRNAYGHAKEGSARGLSIGYLVQPGGAERLKSGVRVLSKLDVREISLVSMPANTAARVTGVKSGALITSASDLARKLHTNLGLPNRLATKMAALAIRAVPGADFEDEAEQEEFEGMLQENNFKRAAAILRRQILQLKGK